MKIAVVVHNRFHAYDLARELIRRGQDATLVTNYPKWAVRRWGVPDERVWSFWPEGVISRAMQKLGIGPFHDSAYLPWFGRWAAARLQKENWDVALCWSSMGEEVFQALEGKRSIRVCHRTSAHIRAQDRLLREERERVGVPLELPHPWSIAREEREYRLADRILVPSSFVRETFLQEGFPMEKLWMVPLGADTWMFRSDPGVVEERIKRILSGAPLRVLNTGTFSYRKGMHDLARAIEAVDPDRFVFRFVGPVLPETRALARCLRQRAEFTGRCPQEMLPRHYAWADFFVLPTIEDGFQLVLGQASVAGLPILTTPNGAGHDLVLEGRNGWLIPVRSPEAIMERLRWCDANREELAEMARRIPRDYRPRDWADVAGEIEKECAAAIGDRGL